MFYVLTYIFGHLFWLCSRAVYILVWRFLLQLPLHEVYIHACMGGYMGSMNYEDLWSTTRSPASGSGFHECNEVIQLKGSCMGCGVLKLAYGHRSL